MRSTRLISQTAALLACALAIGCGSSEQQKTERPARRTINFTVVDTLLGSGFMTSAGLRLWTIKSWPQSNRIEMTAEQETIDAEPFEIHATLLALFLSKATGTVLRLTQFNQTLTRTQVDRMIDERRDYFEAGGAQTTVASFLHGGCEMDQIVAADEETVRIQLFVCHPRAPVYLFDFIVPRAVHADEHRAIESLIGSIKIEPDNLTPMDRSRKGQ